MILGVGNRSLLFGYDLASRDSGVIMKRPHNGGAIDAGWSHWKKSHLYHLHSWSKRKRLKHRVQKKA
jgi:hypothetical protein